jgi:hypothetical protein
VLFRRFCFCLAERKKTFPNLQETTKLDTTINTQMKTSANFGLKHEKFSKKQKRAITVMALLQCRKKIRT